MNDFRKWQTKKNDLEAVEELHQLTKFFAQKKNFKNAVTAKIPISPKKFCADHTY